MTRFYSGIRVGLVRALWKLLMALFLLVALAAAGAGALAWWGQQPLELAAPKVEMSVPPGASLKVAAQQAQAAGARAPVQLLHVFFRAALLWQRWQHPQQPRGTVKPGDYAITQGMTPAQLLERLVRGDRIVQAITFVEGWTFRQMRAALARAEHLKPDTQAMSPEAIMAALGRPGVAAEGRFFPDTYHYARGSR